MSSRRRRPGRLARIPRSHPIEQQADVAWAVEEVGLATPQAPQELREIAPTRAVSPGDRIRVTGKQAHVPVGRPDPREFQNTLWHAAETVRKHDERARGLRANRRESGHPQELRACWTVDSEIVRDGNLVITNARAHQLPLWAPRHATPGLTVHSPQAGRPRERCSRGFFPDPQ